MSEIPSTVLEVSGQVDWNLDTIKLFIYYLASTNPIFFLFFCFVLNIYLHINGISMSDCDIIVRRWCLQALGDPSKDESKKKTIKMYNILCTYV